MSDPLPPLDGFTVETIRNMIRYIADDERIARHVGVPIYKVRRLREEEAKDEFPSYAPTRKQRNENLDAADDRWTRQVRRSSRALAAALKKVAG